MLHFEGQSVGTIGNLTGHETEKVDTIYLKEFSKSEVKDDAVGLL